MARTKKYTNASIPEWVGLFACRSPQVIWDVIGTRERLSWGGLFLFLLWQSGSGSEVYSGRFKWSNQALQNIKFQAPNYKQISNSNIKWPKQVLNFEFWSLLFVWYLGFVFWNFYSSNALVLHDASSLGMVGRQNHCHGAKVLDKWTP